MTRAHPFKVVTTALVWALALTTPNVAAAQDLSQVRPEPRPEAIVTRAESTPSELTRVGPVTGFPIPRYVSLKASEGNIRRGPSRSHRIDWVLTRRGMPLMVVAEHEHWRRVVDQDGQGGWIHHSLLSGERMAVVSLDMIELHQRPDQEAPIRAQAELGAIVRLEECADLWCRIAGGGQRGWVPMSALWGVDPGEEFD